MNKCNRCEHEWKPRAGTFESKTCPGCNSPYWNTPRRIKIVFDPMIHSEDRNLLIEYVRQHKGNMTAAAYHLGESYPTIKKLCDDWKVIPVHIVSKINALSDVKLSAKDPTKAQREMYDEFHGIYQKAHTTGPQFAHKIGVSVEELTMIIRQVMPVTAELLIKARG